MRHDAHRAFRLVIILRNSFAPEGLVPARVLREERESCLVVAPDGEAVAEISGRLRHVAASRLDLPAVGDWAALKPPSSGVASPGPSHSAISERWKTLTREAIRQSRARREAR